MHFCGAIRKIVLFLGKRLALKKWQNETDLDDKLSSLLKDYLI